MNKTLFALLVAGSALGAAALPADAVFATATPQHKAYAGAACLPYNGGVDGRRDVDGSIRNITAAWQNYICPLRIDEVYDGDELLKTKVMLIDGHNAARVTCHVHAYSKDQLPWGWSMVESDYSGLSSSPVAFDFAMVRVPEDGHAVLRCSVPPAQGGNISRIVSYHAGR